MSNTYQKRKASKEYGLYNKCKKLNDDELFRLLDDRNSLKRISSARNLHKGYLFLSFDCLESSTYSAISAHDV